MNKIDEQLELFDRYFEQNDVWKANILIKNIFNKNTDNQSVFQNYFEFCMKIASWNIDIHTREMFLDQASSAIIFFSENTSLTPDLLDMIQICQQEIDEIRQQILEVEKIQFDKKLEATKKQQTEYLRQLTEYKYALEQSKDQSEFNEFLEKVKSVEEQINDSILDDSELQLYEDLTKDYPNVIAKKMTEFERLKVKSYNQKAVKDFHDVFEKFKQNEDQFKTNIYELKRLVGRKLFSYNASQLLNETLIYYNHVYSYIFSKLDNEGKYRLTELAIEMEKAN